MFCSNCGNKLDDGAAFCANCGAKVISEPQTQSVQPQQQGYVQQPVMQQSENNVFGGEQPKKNDTAGKIGCFVAAVAVIAVVGAAAFGAVKLIGAKIGDPVAKQTYAYLEIAKEDKLKDAKKAMKQYLDKTQDDDIYDYDDSVDMSDYEYAGVEELRGNVSAGCDDDGDFVGVGVELGYDGDDLDEDEIDDMMYEHYEKIEKYFDLRYGKQSEPSEDVEYLFDVDASDSEVAFWEKKDMVILLVYDSYMQEITAYAMDKEFYSEQMEEYSEKADIADVKGAMQTIFSAAQAYASDRYGMGTPVSKITLQDLVDEQLLDEKAAQKYRDAKIYLDRYDSAIVEKVEYTDKKGGVYKYENGEATYEVP